MNFYVSIDRLGNTTPAKAKLADQVQAFLDTHDVANECVHGALPHDRKKPDECHCWSSNGNGKP